MTRVRNNKIREVKVYGGAFKEYLQQCMARVRDNEVREVKIYSGVS
jgi:hypothetical protein